MTNAGVEEIKRGELEEAAVRKEMIAKVAELARVGDVVSNNKSEASINETAE